MLVAAILEIGLIDCGIAVAGWVEDFNKGVFCQLVSSPEKIAFLPL